MDLQNLSITARKSQSRLSADQIFLVSGVLAFVAVIQIWIVTAGGVSFPQYSDKYMRLARALLHGQVSLLETPSPQLLALKDPYDVQQNFKFRDPNTDDMVLFKGRYYLYWGPVPALLIAAGSWVIRDPTPDMGDQYLVLAFMFGATVLVAVLMLQIKRGFFPALSKWSIVPPLVTFGLGTPVLFTLARSAAYEAAICGGQFFLLAGLCTGFAAFRKPAGWRFALAGLSWALAVGCRVSLAPAIIAIAMLALFWIWRGFRARKFVRRSALGFMISLSAPLAVGALCLSWYNYVRFQSIFEFGQRFQLTTEESLRIGSTDFVTLGHLVPNLYRYLFEPPLCSSQFPFFTADHGDRAFYDRFHLSHDYFMEPLTGLLWTQPFLLFALGSLYSVVRRRSNRPNEPDSFQASLKLWMIATLASAAVLGIAMPLLLLISTMRYSLDCTPALCVLACIGFFETLDRFRDRPRWIRSIYVSVAGIVILQSVLGILMGFTGYYQHFKTFNPNLYAELVQRLSF